MIVRGRDISEADLEFLRDRTRLQSLRRSARELCDRLQWRGHSGDLQVDLGVKIIQQLERNGSLPLIERVSPIRRFSQAKVLHDNIDLAFVGSFHQLQPIELVEVGSRYSRSYRTWKGMLNKHHYLGAGCLVGPQLRYLIKSPHGWVGAIAISAAARRVGERDRWIGWTEEARRENLPLIICNSRFLILPKVRVPHLASHVLGLLARRLVHDWEARHGYRPVLLESFVDTTRYNGICYQAANWTKVATTQGRGRQDTKHRCAVSKKTLWVYPLCRDFKKRLQTLPEQRRLVPLPPKPVPVRKEPMSSVAEEFNCDLRDLRLTHRLQIVASDFSARLSMPIPQACGSLAKIKATYRLFDNPKMDLQTALSGHYQQTTKRCQDHPIVLSIHDTSELDYCAHPATQGLGPIGNHAHEAKGMHLHPTMAYTETGLPLGLIDVQCWVRDPKHKVHFRKPIEEKESFKWLNGFEASDRLQAACPHTQVVSVSDRESDIYELFVAGQQSVHGTKLLVRAYRERSLENDQLLMENLLEQKVASEYDVTVPKRANRSARRAHVTVRFCSAKLLPPDYLKNKAVPVQMYAILVKEENPPENVEAVEWLLLTNIPVTTVEGALQKIKWYCRRFGIEFFFRTLKSGCRIQDRQLGHALRLESCLAIDMFVAWRVMHLVMLGRDVPKVSCEIFFEKEQWEALYVFTQKEKIPTEPPSLSEVLRLMAMCLGGFLGRKGDGEPGATTVWRGLQRLDDITVMYCAMLNREWVRPVEREVDDTS